MATRLAEPSHDVVRLRCEPIPCVGCMVRGGAPEGKRNGNYKHGGRTKETITSMREVNELLRLVRKLR
jgi:hypothetical protein